HFPYTTLFRSPREDLQSLVHAGRDVERAAEQHVHLLTPLGELVREVHPREGDVPLLMPVLRADRVVHRGLRRERQHGDAVVAELFAIAGQQRDIRGEDLIEQPGGVEEVLEVRRVLLVPEHRGDALLAAVRDELPQGLARGLRSGELVLPGVLVPVPGGLHQQQVHRCLGELLAPRPWRHRDGFELVGPGEHREVVQDHRGPQPGKARGAIGQLRGWEGQRPRAVQRAGPVAGAVGGGASPPLPGAQLRETPGAQMPQTRAQGLERGRRGLRGHRHLRERDRARPSYEPAATTTAACARRCVHHHTRPAPGGIGEVLGIVSGTDRVLGPCTAGCRPAPRSLRRTPVTEQPDDTAPRMRVTVYGSCVARDTVDLAGSDRFDVVAYVARQSLLSADHDASKHFPAQAEIGSDFQRRMMTGDFAGNLEERLADAAAETDVLLWDLADERHGVHVFDDGSVVTRSIDIVRAPEVLSVVEGARHIPFGTDEHFELWAPQAETLHGRLQELEMLSRTVVLRVPWALVTTEGKTTPWSMGTNAREANAAYHRYYEHLAQLGFRILELQPLGVLADPEHRW